MAQTTELISMLADKGYTKKDAKEVIKDVCDCIAEMLCTGQPVQIHKFGTFYVNEGKARRGTNPITHEIINIEASRCAKFTASLSLNTQLNHDKE